jgi:hypothetical protein
MKPVVRIALVAAVGAVVALSWTPQATAFENEAFGITPFPERTGGSDRSSFSIPLETGATFEDAVRVYNLTDEPLRLALYATDALTALDNRISVGLREEHPEGVGRWIDLPLKSLELEPRDAKTVTFRVDVRSSDPEPELGAIVVENTDRGLAGNAAQRLHVLVRTVPPNTQTSSKRVRTFFLQSPWVLIALVGLVLAGGLVWIGARRSRRSRDLVVEPGTLRDTGAEEVQHASRPVIKRLGSSDGDPHAKTSVLDRVRASAGGARRRDERPLLDDALLVEIDEHEEPSEDDDVADEREPSPGPGPSRGETRRSTSKPAPRTTTSKPKSARKPKAASSRASAAKGEPAAKRAVPKRTTAKSKAKPRPAAKKANPKAAARKPKPQDTNFIPLKDL